MALARTLAQHSKPITPRYVNFLREGNGKYSPRALDFASNALQGIYHPRRQKVLRASDAGRCLRRRAFTWLSIPEDDGAIGVGLANDFAIGNFAHLRWQMAGLTEGFLLECERDYASYHPDFLIGARVDGIDFTGGVFEYKTARSHVYQSLSKFGLNYDLEDRWKAGTDYVLQTTVAMLLADVDHASLIVEEKMGGSLDWLEFEVELDSNVAAFIVEECEEFAGYRHDELLPPPLPARAAGEHHGECARCPFLLKCLTVEPTPEQWAKANTVRND